VNSDFAVALSDIILAFGTFVLGMLLKRKKTSQVWVVLFIILAFSAGLGAIYHGLIKFHTREFWVLVSTSATASAFLFLAAVLTVHKPQSKIFSWSWPLIGLAGLLLGGILSPFPFWYISVVSGICLLVSVLLLLNSSPTTARNWIFIGIGITVLALVLQKLAGNTIFHYTQLAANLCFWLGAKRT
jgi:hypothetical protein